MYNSLSAQSIPANFLNQIEEVGEMVRSVCKSLALFVKKLGSLDLRISNYQNQSGYSWIDYGAQLSIKSDFYGYVKINQKNLYAELGELYYNLEVCKQRFNCVLTHLNETKVPARKLTFAENIITFPKKTNSNKEATETIGELLSRTEKVVKAVDEKHKLLASRTEKLILQMRGQFDQ